MQGVLKTFRTNSQNARVLAYLQDGNSLTCLEAMQLGLTHNLKSRISDFKKAGVKINVDYPTVNGTYIAKYSMEKNNG